MNSLGTRLAGRPRAGTSGLNETIHIRMYFHLQTVRCSLHAHLTHDHCPLGTELIQVRVRGSSGISQ